MSDSWALESPAGSSGARAASVPPGTGWPGDVADAATAVAHNSRDVQRLAKRSSDLGELDARISVCRACPRLVLWREDVAVTRRASFEDQQYWGRPVTGFGPADASIAIVGLAPAAHGGNRTGRVFTGDPSGDWLFAALHRVGLANQSESVAADDGLQLHRTRILAAVRCAPPQNKPTTQERDRCAPWLHAELQLLSPSLRVLVALGAFAWQAAFSSLAAVGFAELPGRRPRFGHGVEATCGPITVVGSYHPSQRNTSTHRLTRQMLDDVLGRAATLGRAAE